MAEAALKASARPLAADAVTPASPLREAVPDATAQVKRASPAALASPEPEKAAPIAAAPAAPAAGPSLTAAMPAQAAASERPRRVPAKTMLGISPEAAVGLQRMAAEYAARAPASQASGLTGGATPLVPSLAPPAASIPPTAPSIPGPPKSNANPMTRTMLGMANPLGPPAPPGLNTSTLQGAAVPSDAMPSDPAGARNPDRGAMARTMLGMASLGSNTPPTSSAERSSPPSASGAGASGFGGRTMLGVPHGGGSEAPSSHPPAPSAGPAVAAARSTGRAARDSDGSGRDTARVALPRREMRALWPLAAATLVVVTATLVLLLRPTSEPQVDVSAKIVSSETGEALLFEVPSAPEGSKIRFGGQEKPLSAGRASFALAADSLRVGDNLVLADVVRPDAEPAPVRITLAVYYRIWVDTAALRAERSALDVVVTALPGTRVTLDGEELELDQAGRGVRSYPIDVVSEAKTGVIEHVARYRVQPPSGETVVDELRTRIPVAMMQIDRPGREVLTDRESIEIAGAVGKDTQVHLDKLAIPVKDGRFLYRLMLPEPREYAPRIVASAPGKAPLGVTLAIKRVKDLNQAASQFAPVTDLTYAKLAPDPVIYRGQKISLEGRVYAVDPRGAESVIQMFVRPCPSSRRCPLWVSDPHASEVNVDAWVRVLGVVQGEQQFRSEKNEIVTVPKVEAQFVLPTHP